MCAMYGLVNAGIKQVTHQIQINNHKCVINYFTFPSIKVTLTFTGPSLVTGIFASAAGSRKYVRAFDFAVWL